MTTLQDYFAAGTDRPANLAERLGVEPSTITRILKGERNPSIELAKRIAAETGVSLPSLLPQLAEALAPSTPEAA